MAFSAADPWAASFGAKGQYGSRGDRKPHHGTFTKESQLGQLNELNVSLPELGIDIKALVIAQQLLAAVKTQNRQCYAASTCALFNLVLQASTNPAKEQASVDHTNTDKNPDGLDNKIINMHSTDGDKVTLDDDAGKNESESSNYAFSLYEPIKLDTGEDYIKMPLATYFRVHEEAGDKAKVTRLSGSFKVRQGDGFVPVAGIRRVPRCVVPPHILYAEKFQGQTVVMDTEIETSSNCSGTDTPYFDAGPKSATIVCGMKFKIKSVNQEYTDVNRLDEAGNSAGFGKFRTAYMEYAVIPRTEPNKDPHKDIDD